MARSNFAVLILTHGRPENVVTVRSLKKHGYTGDVVIVIDNEDPTGPEYLRKFKNVQVFDIQPPSSLAPHLSSPSKTH